jgi:hypothetical protein
MASFNNASYGYSNYITPDTIDADEFKKKLRESLLPPQEMMPVNQELQPDRLQNNLAGGLSLPEGATTASPSFGKESAPLGGKNVLLRQEVSADQPDQWQQVSTPDTQARTNLLSSQDNSKPELTMDKTAADNQWLGWRPGQSVELLKGSERVPLDKNGNDIRTTQEQNRATAMNLIDKAKLPSMDAHGFLLTDTEARQREREGWLNAGMGMLNTETNADYRKDLGELKYQGLLNSIASRERIALENNATREDIAAGRNQTSRDNALLRSARGGGRDGVRSGGGVDTRTELAANKQYYAGLRKSLTNATDAESKKALQLIPVYEKLDSEGIRRGQSPRNQTNLDQWLRTKTGVKPAAQQNKKRKPLSSFGG